MLTQEDKINVELIKKIMTEKKTMVPTRRNKDWERVEVKNEKLNKLFTNISTGNITELNELVHAELVCDKIGTWTEKKLDRKLDLKDR